VLRKIDEKLALLEDQADCLTAVGGKQMDRLMQCSNLLEVVDGYIVLNWPNHEWSTFLSSAALSPGLADQLKSIFGFYSPGDG
jgi:hypothetical protein